MIQRKWNVVSTAPVFLTFLVVLSERNKLVDVLLWFYFHLSLMLKGKANLSLVPLMRRHSKSQLQFLASNILQRWSWVLEWRLIKGWGVQNATSANHYRGDISANKDEKMTHYARSVRISKKASSVWMNWLIWLIWYCKMSFALMSLAWQHQECGSPSLLPSPLT